MDNIVDLREYRSLKEAKDHNRILLNTVIKLKNQLESSNYINILLINENESLRKINAMLLEDFKCPVK